MAIPINSLQILQEYLQGVLGRAGHHAGNVEGVALALIGAVIWRSSGQIEVRERDGETANVLWFVVGNNKYAMTYYHPTQSITMRNRTQTGNVLHSFTNATPYQEIINIFSAL